MTPNQLSLSTGLDRLDGILKGLMPGDNLVWLVDDVEDYAAFVQPFARHAREAGFQLVYFRFSAHPPLLGPESGAEIVEPDPRGGFESFVTNIHRVVAKYGRQGYFVFDRLSHLAVDWFSDQMLANFFQLICPYVYDQAGIAYFGLRKGYHSFHATSPIAETTQILIDVYRHRDGMYIHPLKVQQRYSPTMYMLHRWEDDEFVPVLDSDKIAEVLGSEEWSGVESGSLQLDVWSRTLVEAEKALDAIDRGERSAEEAQELHRRLLRMVISRDERVLVLAAKYLTIRDIVRIGKRMVGTGLIGGKSVGMLLARAILAKENPRWADLLEVHDSFYIGSDVFYTYMVRNGCWWVRSKQKDAATFLEGAQHARQRILMGTFPDYIEKKFSDVLDYYGQSPIIVRSSSLLEDNFGNAFSGKYDSVFCPNQGSRHRRLEDFVTAVKTVYASSMSERALRYRAERGLLDRDEQMSLLVQRVSGSLVDTFFYPQVAGVGFSFNPYVWNPDIDPEAGVLRLVFGLGTRAVDRRDDDYTRVVALNAPSRQPEAGFDDAIRYSQRKVDVLDLGANQLTSIDVSELVRRSQSLPLDLYVSQDDSVSTGGRASAPMLVTFRGLFEKTAFVADMREMLSTLERAYETPVDIEFTANMFGADRYRINLLQCRPFQVKEGGALKDLPMEWDNAHCMLSTRGPVIGRSRAGRIDRVVYVVPEKYAALPNQDRFAVARLIGRITHLRDGGRQKSILLIGPGRWGTTTPTLGVPVSTNEINAAVAVCELVMMHSGLVPDVSLGTHFFNDLVETDMLYLALTPGVEGHALNSAMLDAATNRLTRLVSDAEKLADVVRVIDAEDIGGGGALMMYGDTYSQRVMVRLEGTGEARGVPSDSPLIVF